MKKAIFSSTFGAAENKNVASKFNNVKIISTPVKSDIDEEIPEEVVEEGHMLQQREVSHLEISETTPSQQFDKNMIFEVPPIGRALCTNLDGTRVHGGIPRL